MQIQDPFISKHMGKRSPESTFSSEYISDKAFVHNTISSFVPSLISKHPYPYFSLNTITSAADILSVDSYMSIYAWSGYYGNRTHVSSASIPRIGMRYMDRFLSRAALPTKLNNHNR